MKRKFSSSRFGKAITFIVLGWVVFWLGLSAYGFVRFFDGDCIRILSSQTRVLEEGKAKVVNQEIEVTETVVNQNYIGCESYAIVAGVSFLLGTPVLAFYLLFLFLFPKVKEAEVK